MWKRICALNVMLFAGLAGTAAMTGAAHAECIMAGGQGFGPVASFMAKAAMKNSIKAWAGGKKVKVDEPTVTCTNLSMNCTAKARACK